MSLHEYLFYIIMPILALSVLLIFVRFVIGPSITDRVVALDLLIITGMGLIAVYSILTDQPTFLDIAMIFALLAFLSSVAFSFYLKQRRKND